MVAGAILPTAGLFPAFAMKLLDFVALYGFILAPVGAIIVTQHLYGTRFHIPDYLSSLGSGIQLESALGMDYKYVMFYGLSVQLDLFLPLTYPLGLVVESSPTLSNTLLKESCSSK